MTDTLVAIDSVRQRFTVTGVVQGVGFRPFVHRIATELGLTGFVGNDSGAVFLEVQGPGARIDEFRHRLRAEVPPLAAISAVQVVDVDADTLRDSGFRIVESQPVAGATTPIPPDIAVCDDCIAELFDPGDRRYRHPFVTCTNCGPRFTIIRALPYDRPATTMSAFAMCERCAAEYHDAADRRFHAQPIACPDCGPSLWFAAHAERVAGSDAALGATQQALAAVAVGALILGKMFGESSAPASSPAPAPGRVAPPAAPAQPLPTNAPAGSILGGLTDLIGKLSTGGVAPQVNSWVGHGTNEPVQPGQLGSALGQNVLAELSQRTGMSQQELLSQLSTVLPQIINHMTPNGRMPTLADLER